MATARRKSTKKKATLSAVRKRHRKDMAALKKTMARAKKKSAGEVRRLKKQVATLKKRVKARAKK